MLECLVVRELFFLDSLLLLLLLLLLLRLVLLRRDRHGDPAISLRVAMTFEKKVFYQFLPRKFIAFFGRPEAYHRHVKKFVFKKNYRGGPRSLMATTPDSHAGGPGFKSRCRPTNFGAHLPYTPPPGRKDVSRVPKGMVYAKAEHPE